MTLDEEMKIEGYEPNTDCYRATIIVGNGTKIHSSVKIWDFTTICDDVVIEKNVVIGGRCFIGKGTIIREGTHIQDGVFLPNESKIGKNVFIGPNATFTDDRRPKAGNAGYMAEPPIVEDGASIGAGAVVLPGIIIGCGAMVGAGAVITKNVNQETVIIGNPGRILL